MIFVIKHDAPREHWEQLFAAIERSAERFNQPPPQVIPEQPAEQMTWRDLYRSMMGQSR